MSSARVVLVTLTGPGGRLDAGVRVDATPFELARNLFEELGLTAGRPLVTRQGPPRPQASGAGSRLGSVRLSLRATLDEGGVVDGDVLVFGTVDDVGPESSAGEVGVRDA